SLPVTAWLYYCVDDFSVWPGLEQRTLGELERQVITKADRCVAAGESLLRHLKEHGKDATLIRHGVDLGKWRNSRIDSQTSGLLERFQKPLVLFWGLIDRRLDVNLIRATSEGMSSGTILLVGPVQDADPELWKIP